MSVTSHITSLEHKHQQLKEAIAQEMAHPLPDFMRITELKKQKLALKEEIAKYSHDLLEEAS